MSDESPTPERHMLPEAVRKAAAEAWPIDPEHPDTVPCRAVPPGRGAARHYARLVTVELPGDPDMAYTNMWRDPTDMIFGAINANPIGDIPPGHLMVQGGVLYGDDGAVESVAITVILSDLPWDETYSPTGERVRIERASQRLPL